MIVNPAALFALLDDNVSYDQSYGAGLSNHLPMALGALALLGADDGRLLEFHARSSRKLRPAVDDGYIVTRSNWAHRLGERDAFATYRRYYDSELRRTLVAEVVGNAVSMLAGGIGGAAFHALIELGYGLRLNHRGEIASGLASLASCWMPLGELKTLGYDATIAERVAVLRLKVGTPRGWPSDGLISSRMEAVASQLGFTRHAALPDGLALKEIARYAAESYWHQPNFTLLHLVTGANALSRVVAAGVPEAVVLPGYWQAFCAATLTVPMADKLVTLPVPSRLPDWATIRTHAIASDDDHVIKLVQVCDEIYAETGEAIYQAIAAREIESQAG
jgi:hypothetical protein